MPPRNLLAARAMTKNCEASVLGPRPPGPSPPFQPRPCVGPPAAWVASSPFPQEGDPASAPLLQVAQPGPHQRLVGAPSAASPAAAVHHPRPAAAPSRRLLGQAARPPQHLLGLWPPPAHLADIPALASPPHPQPAPLLLRPGAPSPGGSPAQRTGWGPGGGGVDARAAPPAPQGSAARRGRGRAHLPSGQGTVRRQSRSGRAGRRARAAAPSFRTARAAAPARGRDRTAGGAHAPAGLAPSARSPAPPAARPRVLPPRAAAAGTGRSRERSALLSQPRAGVPRARQ